LTSRIALTASLAAALAVGPATAAGAAAPEPSGSPRATCAALAQNAPEAYEFIATKPGACESSVASVGVEALMAGAFPSQASAVGNCKALEADFPNGYPYTFYEGVLDNPAAVAAEFKVPLQVAQGIVANYLANVDLFKARNRAGCVRVLQRLHSGELFGLLFAGAGSA
jgi:hypothetical protein